MTVLCWPEKRTGVAGLNGGPVFTAPEGIDFGITNVAISTGGIVDFGDPFPSEPAWHRPALVVGPIPEFGTQLPFVIVCPLTTTHRGLPVHVEVEPDATNGLGDLSYVQCELVRSVGRGRLVHRLGSVGAEVSFAVHDVLALLLGH